MADAHRPSAGVSAAVTDTPTNFLKTDHTIEQVVTVSNVARDSGNTGYTTTLRPGLVMGRITATGNYKEYNDSCSDGSQVARGILKQQTKVIDSDAVATDATANIVIHGYVDESALHGCDANAQTDLDNIIFDENVIKEA